MSNKGQLLQDPFLNTLRREHIPVSIYLVNGIKLQGQIDSFDQYVVLLKNTDADAARAVAEKIRLRTEQLAFGYADKVLDLTVSIGLSAHRSDDTLHTLIARADDALYRAKQGGRNRVCSEL